MNRFTLSRSPPRPRRPQLRPGGGPAARPRAGRHRLGAGRRPGRRRRPDGPEAKGVATFKLDDIIEVAVRLSPDIARPARIATSPALRPAPPARISRGCCRRAPTIRGARSARTRPTDQLAPLAAAVDAARSPARSACGRNLPTGGNIALELGLTHAAPGAQRAPARRCAQTGTAGMQAPQSQCGENVDIFCQDQALARLTLKQPLARGLGSDVALAPPAQGRPRRRRGHDQVAARRRGDDPRRGHGVLGARLRGLRGRRPRRVARARPQAGAADPPGDARGRPRRRTRSTP